MSKVIINDHRDITTPTFSQLSVGQWFLDDVDTLFCKTDFDQAFAPNFGLATFCDEDEITVVEEIRIEIIK